MGCIAGQSRAALLQDAGVRGSPAPRPGRIAQLVEQLTLNQRVPGSSPGAPTIPRKAPPARHAESVNLGEPPACRHSWAPRSAGRILEARCFVLFDLVGGIAGFIEGLAV